jgi:hypothetical protein
MYAEGMPDEAFREYGISLLRQVADDWDKRADEFERLEHLPEDVAPGRLIHQYRWAASRLRRRARDMELQAQVDGTLDS